MGGFLWQATNEQDLYSELSVPSIYLFVFLKCPYLSYWYVSLRPKGEKGSRREHLQHGGSNWIIFSLPSWRIFCYTNISLLLYFILPLLVLSIDAHLTGKQEDFTCITTVFPLLTSYYCVELETSVECMVGTRMNLLYGPVATVLNLGCSSLCFVATSFCLTWL